MSLPDKVFTGRDLHCDEDRGGDRHFHCAKCGAVCSVLGHTDVQCENARDDGRDRPAFVYGQAGTT